MIPEKHIFNNKSYESYGESPFSTSFRCCCAPLVGIFKTQSYAQQQRDFQNSVFLR